MDDKSITAVKADFLRVQVRQLSTPLEAPSRGHDSLAGHDEARLSEKVIQGLVSKVNEKIKTHNRQVFSTQSQQHVAEQIDTLHWNLATAESDRADIDTVVVRRDAELTHTPTIQSLPDHYQDLPLHPEHEAIDTTAEGYRVLRADLVEMSEKRDVLRRRLAQYQSLQKLLEPLHNPQQQIQPNLVTRDGDIGKELDRTQVLVARLTDSLAKHRRQPNDQSHPEIPPAHVTHQQKLVALMDTDMA